MHWEMFMDKKSAVTTAYICPMHSDVRQSPSGKCPRCGMALVPENTRFALLRHMFGSPLHIVIMAAVMVAIMGVVMMMR
jgi:Heavy metal binding domain